MHQFHLGVGSKLLLTLCTKDDSVASPGCGKALFVHAGGRDVQLLFCFVFVCFFFAFCETQVAIVLLTFRIA